MTTIAWDGEILAVESRITRDNRVVTDAQQKLFVDIGRFQAIAFCGCADYYHSFMEWAKEEKENAPKGDYLVVVVINNQAYEIDLEQGFKYKYMLPGIAAVGSGGTIATAAMYAGKNAIEAVEIATQLDVYSGGPVQHYKINI